MNQLFKAFALSLAILPIFTSDAINVIVKNQSGRLAWIQFVGNKLQVSPSGPTSINAGNCFFLR